MTDTWLNDITPDEWSALASRRIFFGHQSVGRDLMTGVRKLLLQQPDTGLRIVNVDNSPAVDGPGFFEANIGANRFPHAKADEFASIVSGKFANVRDSIVMYKYCYVDVGPETDPTALFEDYERRIDRLQSEHPDLTIVHFTVPLKTAPDGIAEALRTRLGRATQTRLNVKRQQYNELLRDRFREVHPVFDLALMESTRSDGTRAYARTGGEDIPMLAPEWTHDGGHLNEQAQYRFASELLRLLVRLANGTLNASTVDCVKATLIPINRKD